MKKLFVLLLITLSVMTTSFSQSISNGTKKDSIVSITSAQLKETNLIFAEHKKLLTENALLKEQIDNYKEENKYLLKADSLRVSQLMNYKSLTDSYTSKINFLNKEINRKNRVINTWKIGGITVSIGLIAWLLLK